MEATSTALRHWEDVVFENRNKDYGAYLLRKAYARRLMTGLGVTVILVSIMLSMQGLHTDPEVTAAPPLIGKRFEPMPPPSIIRPEPPRDIIRSPRTPARRTQIIVTREEVTETEIEAVRDLVAEGPATEGATGIIDGPGTIPIEIPARIEPDVVRSFAEVMPEYAGGMEAMMKFIQKKIRYPQAPRRIGIGGTVYVEFVVKGDGTVTDVRVLRGVHPDYDREAVRVVSLLPAWRGGAHNGQPVSVKMVLPIKFNLME